MQIQDAGKFLISKWQNLGTRQRTITLLVGIPLLVSLAFLAFFGGDTPMVPLFNHLEPQDAAKVVEQLKTNNVKYRLVDQGSTILVPENEVYDLRLQMITDGAVSSGGFELFDQTALGATDFERRVNYQRALQEELRRTIIQMDGVEQARVHIVLPEESVFIQEEKPSSASIAVKLKPLKKLTDEQIQSIVLLVQNSVDGLQGENISLIDMEGNILMGGDSSGTGVFFTEQTLRQQKVKEAFEQQMQARVQSLLDAIFAPGKARVVVTADLDFSRHERRSITYGDQAVRSEAGSANGIANLPGAGGIAGVESNVNDYEAIADEEETMLLGTDSEDYTRNYEVDTMEEIIVFSPGEVEKISAAVVVDGFLSQEKSAEISRVVGAALGLNPNRGDQLTVSGINFDTTLQDEMEKSWAEDQQKEEMAERKAQRMFWVKCAAALLGALLAAFFIVRALKLKNIGPLPAAAALEKPGPANETAQDLDAIKLSIKEQQRNKVKKYFQEKPEDAANILKTWLRYEE
ncbi:MAG: flagellar basal-body MS-ring/collar protein FliF [Bacillota bacterium]|jgi:flagellar M-ring protein FliF|nr:flagellar M-ring protein FliF [Clostridia bacterium]